MIVKNLLKGQMVGIVGAGRMRFVSAGQGGWYKKSRISLVCESCFELRRISALIRGAAASPQKGPWFLADALFTSITHREAFIRE
jgi:hypothetical protein